MALEPLPVPRGVEDADQEAADSAVHFSHDSRRERRTDERAVVGLERGVPKASDDVSREALAVLLGDERNVGRGHVPQSYVARACRYAVGRGSGWSHHRHSY